MTYLLLAYYRDSLQQSTKRDDMHVVGVLDADFREWANPKAIVDTAFKASVLKREDFDPYGPLDPAVWVVYSPDFDQVIGDRPVYIEEVGKNVDESLPELIPVCPHCNYGGPGATFESVEFVFANAEFYPRLEADGSIEREYTGNCEVCWDTQGPAKDWIPDQPRYLCPNCWREFDEFKIATKEEFAWIKMMQARR